MAEPTGRREANKQATRAALRSAAKQLFASQGFERTTVRDIARLANVTERTFYRYFDGSRHATRETPSVNHLVATVVVGLRRAGAGWFRRRRRSQW